MRVAYHPRPATDVKHGARGPKLPTKEKQHREEWVSRLASARPRGMPAEMADETCFLDAAYPSYSVQAHVSGESTSTDSRLFIEGRMEVLYSTLRGNAMQTPCTLFRVSVYSLSQCCVVVVYCRMMHMIDVIYCVLCIESCSCRVFASSDRGTVVCCCAVPMDVCARDAECHDVKVKTLVYTEYKYCICIYNNNYYIYIYRFLYIINI